MAGFGAGVRRLVVLVAGVVLAAAAIAVPGTPAGAAAASAAASVTPGIQYLADPGTTFIFTVQNTSATATVGAVEVARASTSRTVIGCPGGPVGWTVERNDYRCRYRSAPGTTDDLQPGAVTDAFQVSVLALSGTQNTSATWSVKVSGSEGVRLTGTGPGPGSRVDRDQPFLRDPRRRRGPGRSPHPRRGLPHNRNPLEPPPRFHRSHHRDLRPEPDHHPPSPRPGPSRH